MGVFRLIESYCTVLISGVRRTVIFYSEFLYGQFNDIYYVASLERLKPSQLLTLSTVDYYYQLSLISSWLKTLVDFVDDGYKIKLVLSLTPPLSVCVCVR